MDVYAVNVLNATKLYPQNDQNGIVYVIYYFTMTTRKNFIGNEALKDIYSSEFLYERELKLMS